MAPNIRAILWKRVILHFYNNHKEWLNSTKRSVRNSVANSIKAVVWDHVRLCLQTNLQHWTPWSVTTAGHSVWHRRWFCCLFWVWFNTVPVSSTYKNTQQHLKGEGRSYCLDLLERFNIRALWGYYITRETLHPENLIHQKKNEQTKVGGLTVLIVLIQKYTFNSHWQAIKVVSSGCNSCVKDPGLLITN